jgi:drug/metabolite transporter (DMT)-like permease
VVFGEPVMDRWWLGASLMLLGVVMINRDAARRQHTLQQDTHTHTD